MTLTPGKRGLIAAALVAGLVSVPAGSAVAAQPSKTEAKAAAIDAARTKLFGAGYQNPNEVRGRAVGNTTWLMSFGGTVLLQDSTVEDQLTDTGKDANTNGFVSVDDVVAAKPDMIVQDHTHFDQQHNVTEIATRTGTPMVTDLFGCIFQKKVAYELGYDGAKVNCNLVRSNVDGRPFYALDSWAGSYGGYYSGQGLDLGLIKFTAYGEKGRPEVAVPGVFMEAEQIKHGDPFFPRPQQKLGTPGTHKLSGSNFDVGRSAADIQHDYQNDPVGTAANLYKQYAPFDAEGSNLAWLVKYKDFSMIRHGSATVTAPDEPGWPAIQKGLQEWRDAGDRIDVEFGSIAEVTYLLDGNYFQDAKEHAKAIGAKMWMPLHHYNWYPIWLTNPAASYYEGWSETWADGKKEDAANFPQKSCFLTEANYATVWSWKSNQLKGDKLTMPTAVSGPGCYTG